MCFSTAQQFRCFQNLSKFDFMRFETEKNIPLFWDTTWYLNLFCSTFTEILYTGLYKAHEGSLSSFFTDFFDYFLSDDC